MQIPEHTDEQVKTAVPVGEPFPEQAEPAYPRPTPEEVDGMFREAYLAMPTQPLTRQMTSEERIVERHLCVVVLVVYLALLAEAIIGVLTYPTATITLVPVGKRVNYTTQLAIPTRRLEPVTLSKSMSTLTTGHGQQAATRARGILTFYNGQATPKLLQAEPFLPRYAVYRSSPTRPLPSQEPRRRT